MALTATSASRAGNGDLQDRMRQQLPGHYGFKGILLAEWTKLRSVRSTIWSLVATVVATLAIGAIATATEAARWSHEGLVSRLTFDPTSLSLTGLLLGQLAIGVLGVLTVSAEYGTGTIQATFAATPKRSLVLMAKATVFGLVAFVVSEASSFAAFITGQAILAGSTPHATLLQPGVARAVIGGGLYLTVLGLLALGLAALIRHTAGAITAFVGILLILPLIVQALPSSVADALGRYMPATIGVRLLTVNPAARLLPTFSPWVGFAVLCGYAAFFLLLGGWTMVHRDA